MADNYSKCTLLFHISVSTEITENMWAIILTQDSTCFSASVVTKLFYSGDHLFVRHQWLDMSELLFW